MRGGDYKKYLDILYLESPDLQSTPQFRSLLSGVYRVFYISLSCML